MTNLASTRPTTSFWQRIDDAASWPPERLAPPWKHGVPVRLRGGGILELPIRQLPTAGLGVASLIANQASFDVVERLSRGMASLSIPLGADAVIGLPTLGMVFAPAVARALGHARYVPLGYSRKFWYDEALSTDVASITTPGLGKRIYLDPNQWPLVKGRRVVVVDDAVSSGQTAVQVWNLLESLEIEVVGMVVAMCQGHAWQTALGPQRAARVHGVFDSPLLQARDDGWWPRAA